MFRRLMQVAGLALAPFAALLGSRVFGMLAAAPVALAYFLRRQKPQMLTYHRLRFIARARLAAWALCAHPVVSSAVNPHSPLPPWAARAIV